MPPSLPSQCLSLLSGETLIRTKPCAPPGCTEGSVAPAKKEWQYSSRLASLMLQHDTGPQRCLLQYAQSNELEVLILAETKVTLQDIGSSDAGVVWGRSA